MSDVNYSLILVSGAPVAAGLNKSYFIDDATATGHDRLWRSSSTQRIFWDASYGWCIGDLNGSSETMIYFYSNTQVEYANPWDVTTWVTTIESFQSYNPVLIGSTDPEIETTTETVQDNNYVDVDLEKTPRFLVGQTYYYPTGMTSCPYVATSTIIINQAIPDNTYYVLSGDNYVLTTDAVFKSTVTYYTRTYTKDTTTPYLYVPAVVAGNEIPANTYKLADGKITKVVATTVNHRTGETTQNVTQTVTKYGETLTEHVRYSLPKIEVGKIYRFAFVDDFVSLGYIKPTSLDYNDGESSENDSDITRGIYEVQAVTNYRDLVLGAVDIYQNLYLPLGIPKEVYEQDKAKWMGEDVWYKLVNPMLAAQVFYVPTAIIDGIPDGNVTAYDRYHMIIEIGIFSDPELLTELVTCVNMLFKAKFGIPTSAQLASYDKVYLPSSYSDWMEAQRVVNINQFMKDHADQYFNTLFKTEYNDLYKENAALKIKNETYEEMIGNLAK